MGRASSRRPKLSRLVASRGGVLHPTNIQIVAHATSGLRGDDSFHNC